MVVDRTLSGATSPKKSLLRGTLRHHRLSLRSYRPVWRKHVEENLYRLVPPLDIQSIL